MVHAILLDRPIGSFVINNFNNFWREGHLKTGDFMWKRVSLEGQLHEKVKQTQHKRSQYYHLNKKFSLNLVNTKYGAISQQRLDA